MAARSPAPVPVLLLTSGAATVTGGLGKEGQVRAPAPGVSSWTVRRLEGAKTLGLEPVAMSEACILAES